MNDANLIERIQDIVLNINPLNVVTDAQAAGLNVDKPEDFINHAHKYVFIEKLMKKYARSASMYSAMSPHCQNSCHPHPNNLNGGKGDNHGTIQSRTQTSNTKQTAIA